MIADRILPITAAGPRSAKLIKSGSTPSCVHSSSSGEDGPCLTTIPVPISPSPAEATRAAKTLLPDMIYYDPRRPARFPDNGRALTDDVVDVFISILSNGKSKGDGVGSHKDLLNEFPYVGPPHKVRSRRRWLRFDRLRLRHER